MKFSLLHNTSCCVIRSNEHYHKEKEKKENINLIKKDI